MPKLFDSRISGVVYDKIKLMDDIPYYYKGMNTLKILENGGGKTTTIQLMIQPILPNKKVGKRYLKDTLSESKHGHIALEWLLDDRFVVTGFYFSIDRTNNSYPLTYHTYIYEHKMDQGQVLKSLPFLREGKVTSWRDLKTHFTKNMSIQNRFESFTSSKEDMKLHANKLRSYNIIPEEFEAIVSINGDEGDVEKYFETADTTERLLRKILIPRIEVARYPSEEKRDILIENFLKYRERILNIPLMRHQIKQLDEFELASKELMECSFQTHYAKEEFASSVSEYKGAMELLERKKESLEQERAALGAEQLKIEKTIHELNWKLDSYPLYLEQESLDRERLELERLEKKFKVLEEDKKKAEYNLKRVQAFLSYQDYQESDIKVKAINQQLEDLDKEEPELKLKVEKERSEFKHVWDTKKKETFAAWAVVTNEFEETASKEDENTKRKEELIGLMATNSATLTTLNDWLLSYDEVASKTVEIAGPDAKVKTIELLNTFTDESKRLAETHSTESANLQMEQEQFYKEKDRLSENKNQKLEELRKNHEEKIKEKVTEITQKIESKREDATQLQASIGKEKDTELETLHAKLEETQKNAQQDYENARKDKETSLQKEYEQFLEAKQKLLNDFMTTKNNEITYLETINKEQADKKEELEREQIQTDKEIEKGASLISQKEERESAIIHLLNKYGQNLSSLYKEKELQEKLKSELTVALAEKTEVETARNDTAMRYGNLCERGYLPPHHDLVKVRDHLLSDGIKAELGKEYVTKSKNEQESKFLVHAILIDEVNTQKVEKSLEGMGDWLEEVPLLLVNKQLPLGPTTRLQNVQEGVFLFNPSNMDVYISPEKIEELKRNLKVQLDALQVKLENWNNKETQLRTILTDWNHFEKTFPEEQLIVVKEALPALKQKLSDLTTEISEIKASNLRNELAIKQAGKDIKQEQEKTTEAIDGKRIQTESEKEGAVSLLKEKCSKKLSAAHMDYRKNKNKVDETYKVKLEELQNKFTQVKSELETILREWEKSQSARYKEKNSFIFNVFTEKFDSLEQGFKTLQTAALARILELNKREEVLKPIIEALHEFKPFAISVSEKRNLQSRLLSENKQYVSEKGNIEQLIEKIKGEMENLRHRKVVLGQLVDKLKEDEITFSLSDVYATPCTDTFDEKRLKLNQALLALNEKSAGRTSLEDRKADFEKNKVKEKENIEFIGFSFEWVASNASRVSKFDLTQANAKKKDAEDKVNKERSVLVNAKLSYEGNKATHEEKAKQTRDKHQDNGYADIYRLFTDRHQLEHDGYVSEKTNNIMSLQKVKDSIVTTSNQLTNIEKTVDKIDPAYIALEEAKAVSLPATKMEGLLKSPISYCKTLADEIKILKETYEKKKLETKKTFEDYILNANRSQETLKMLALRIETILQNNRIYDYNYVETEFKNIYQAIQDMKDTYQRELEESEKNKNFLVQECIRKAEIVYEGVKEIPSYSKVEIRGKEKKMLDFEWTHWGEQGEDKLGIYLELVITEMNKMKETGKEDGTDKVRDYANHAFSIVQILNVLSPIKNAKIRVIKPRNYEEMKEGRIGLEDWKEVAHWSGGEKTTVYMTLFMILINYIRTQNREFGNPWKVIIADNPFGKASSQHIIQPIFEIAKRNQIQLICLTAHKNEEVVRSFPVVYSIKLRSQLDNVFIRTTEEKTSQVTLESVYYRKEKGDLLPTEEKVEIMDHETFNASSGQFSLF